MIENYIRWGLSYTPGEGDDTPSGGDWNFAGILKVDDLITQVEPPVV